MPLRKLALIAASRHLAAFLILALALPSPALALRPMNAGMEENPANQSLRRDLLGPTPPAAGAEEINISTWDYSGLDVVMRGGERVVPIPAQGLLITPKVRDAILDFVGTGGSIPLWLSDRSRLALGITPGTLEVRAEGKSQFFVFQTPPLRIGVGRTPGEPEDLDHDGFPSAGSVAVFGGDPDVANLHLEMDLIPGGTVKIHNRSRDGWAYIPVEALEAIRSAVKKQSPRAAGAEEGKIQVIFNQLLKEPEVRGPLLDKGWFPLNARRAQALGFKAVGGLITGGFIIADSAKLTDPTHAIIAENGLGNEAVEKMLAWIRAGDGAPEVVRNARLFNARKGDLIVLKEKPDLSVEQVKALLQQNGIEGPASARTLVGGVQEVENLPIFAFQLLAGEEGLPAVVVLNVAVRLQDEAGNSYTLILMA